MIRKAHPGRQNMLVNQSNNPKNHIQIKLAGDAAARTGRRGKGRAEPRARGAARSHDFAPESELQGQLTRGTAQKVIPPWTDYQSQLNHSNLCWAACAVMIEKYFINKHYEVPFQGMNSPDPVLEMAKLVNDGKTDNVMLPNDQLEKKYSEHAKIFCQSDGFEFDIREEDWIEMLEKEPVMLWYGPATDPNGDGHFVVIAGRSNDGKYAFYDPNRPNGENEQGKYSPPTPRSYAHLKEYDLILTCQMRYYGFSVSPAATS
jgi:hypothetical protein